MKRWLQVLLLLCLYGGSTFAHARVWDGMDLIKHASSDGTNMCALTFDDGPSAYTAQILQALENEGISATFFMLGAQIKAHPDIVRRIARAGHDIGIHSQTHPNMKKLRIEKQAIELILPIMELYNLGIAPRWFRPPYGNMNATLKELAGYLGLSIIIWTHDSKDWKRVRTDYANMESISANSMKAGAMHGVFLFHDTSARTATDLPEIIRILRERGCQRFVTISEFTGEKERAMPTRKNEEVYSQAGKALTNVLHSLKESPNGAWAILLADAVQAVEKGTAMPNLAMAGLQIPPMTRMLADKASQASPSKPQPQEAVLSAAYSDAHKAEKISGNSSTENTDSAKNGFTLEGVITFVRNFLLNTPNRIADEASDFTQGAYEGSSILPNSIVPKQK